MDWFLHDNDLRHERVKCNLNIFKNVVIILQEIVAAFTPFITTAKRIRKVFCDWGLGGRGVRGGANGRGIHAYFVLSYQNSLFYWHYFSQYFLHYFKQNGMFRLKGLE